MSALFGTEEPPAKLGRYEVRGLLGRGGTSRVYEAYDPELDRKVALKLIDRARFGGRRDGELEERLLREGRALAKLRHPHVLDVLEIGSDDDDVFLVIELVEGQDLAEWLDASPRDWRTVVDVMLGVGEGLAAAHERGLVHRDVKPTNVLIDGEGTARLADFGLVYPSEQGAGAPVDSGVHKSVSMTQTGARLGSPAYMASEQWRGETADALTDQFGYCVTFFEALCGTRPFAGGDEDAIMRAVCDEQLVDVECGGAPSWLLELVRTGLRADRDERHPSMRGLLDAVAAGMTTHRSLEQANDLLRELATEPSAQLAARVDEALRRALEATPDHPEALAAQVRLHEAWFDMDLAQGALDAAERHLAVAEPSAGPRRARLDAARSEADELNASAEALARMKYDADAGVAIDFKVRTMWSQAFAYLISTVIISALHRSGTVTMGPGTYAVIFGANFVLHVWVTRVAQPDAWAVNQLMKNIVDAGAMNLVGLVLMFSAGWWFDLELSTTFVFVQAALTAFWFGTAHLFDRTLHVVTVIALLGGLAIIAWPDFGIEIFGFATVVAFGALGVMWKLRPDDPEVSV